MNNQMGDDQLVAIIEENEALAVNDEVINQQADAVARYLGDPYGDEQEGRSSIVMRDVADTIEWIKPSLLKVFAAGDEVVSFTPQGPEDEDQAQQETDYCNYVLMNKNPGFMILHDWFHDALLQKNGYVVVTHEVERRTDRSRYKNLTPEELQLVLKQGGEVVERSEDGTEVVVQSDGDYGCLRIRVVPPERVVISHIHPDLDLQECPFTEVMEFQTIADLRKEGFEVEDTISDDWRDDGDVVEEVRRREQDWTDEQNQTGDPSMRNLKVRRIWMRVDWDGDGFAELRYIVIVGRTILKNEEDDIVPVAAISAIRMPHDHIGISIADIVDDLQRIRTVLMRGFLDSMYLANNGRYGVDVNMVNLDDMLTSRPGGIVRVNGSPNAAMFPLLHPTQSGPILQAMEFVDVIRENRTGVTRYNQGIDANSLNKTASGITQIMNASQQRIELIARLFAETGVKCLMRIIQALSIKNGRSQEMVKLRNKWIPVDPSAWKRRYDLTVSVGLGVGNKDQNLMHLQNILMAQKEAMPIGLATPQNIYNSLVKLTQNAGFKNVDDFWTNPEQAPPSPPPIPPEVQKEQIRVQADAQKFQAQSQLDVQKAQFDAAESEKDRQAELFKAIEVERIKQQAETERKAMELQAQREGVAVGAQVNFRQPELEGVAQTIGAAQSEVAQAFQMFMQSQEQQTQMLAALLESINRPKTVIRGPDGRVAGVQ